MRNEGDIGLVLSGGGAKGAYQAGVWKAMCELGLARRVRAISGTSVGALNAAAFATVRDPEAICRFWRTRVGEVATPYLRKLTVGSFRRAAENVLAGKAFPFHGLLDRGIYIAPSQFECNFISAAHCADDIGRFVEAFGGACDDAARGGS